MSRLETFLIGWNGEFLDYPLTVLEMKKPNIVIGAFLLIFEKLGIDADVVLSVPEEIRNDHTDYYWDLIPVINMTRIINHFISDMPQKLTKANLMTFLQPIVSLIHSNLLLLFNLMVFHVETLQDIAPYENELFAKTDQVKTLEEKKNKLLEMLNEQAVEKGNRIERLQKIDHDLKQLAEESKQDKELHDKVAQELQEVLKEKQQIEIVLEQKKSHRDALMAEVTRKRALRVYDAEDVQAQAEQAAQNVQEAEEKLESLGAILMQKETSLKNLQTIKPNLDTAHNLAHDIMKLTDSLKELECGDVDTESKESEMEVLSAEVVELSASLGELRAARAEGAARRAAASAARHHEQTVTHSTLREAEDKDKKHHDKCKKALQKTEEIKAMTVKYEEEKAAGLEELASIKNQFCNELNSMQDMLFNMTKEIRDRIVKKLCVQPKAP